MGIIKDGEEIVTYGIIIVVILFLWMWVLVGFFGGLQFIWYVINRKRLKGKPYTMWFAGHPYLYFYILLMSIIIGVMILYGLYFASINNLPLDVMGNIFYSYTFIMLLGIWYPYAFLKNMIKGNHRVLRNVI